MKKTNKNKNMGMALGMCLGVSIGTSFGTVFDNIGIGSSMGLCIGMLIGLALGEQKDKQVNQQIKEQGYAIKEIESISDKEYTITIVNKLGEEQNISVSKGEMKEEDFVVGDIVFLNEDGLLEQAYDKEDNE